MSDATKVLIIHGREAVCEPMQSTLAKSSSPPQTARSIEIVATLADALEALERQLPDVVLLGLELADSSGMNTLRVIRAKCRPAPIVVLVESEDHATGAKAIGNGAQDYLFCNETRINVIDRTINRAIERRRVEEEHADTGWRTGIGQTALGIRHEINNPLAALLLNVEMLKEGGHGDATELIEGIEIAAKRIAAVVRRLEGLRTPQRVPALGGEAMVDLSDQDRKPATGETKKPAAKPPESTGGGKTILLVDDEKSVRAVVVKILSRDGHTVLEAEHGAAALRLAKSHDGPIDLLITDMYMPGLRGPEIVERLQSMRPGVPALYMSGYGDEDVARSGVGPGSSFLRKPFTVQELRDAVRKVLAEPVKP